MILSRNQTSITTLNIFYSTDHRLDKKHAERLRNLRNVILHPVSDGGRDGVKIIRNNRELKFLITPSFKI